MISGGRRLPVYLLLHSFLKQLAPNWRKTQLSNLTLLAYAIYQRRSLSLAELARSYPYPDQPRIRRPKHMLFHQLKRLRRFLNNPHLDFAGVFRYLVQLGNIACRHPGMTLPILLDPTYFGEYTAVVASVPFCGRALPIAVRVFCRNLQSEEELSQNEIIQKVVKEVRDHIAPAIQMVLVADREFASAELFRYLKSINVGFAIRVDSETWIEHRGYRGPIGELPIKRGGQRLWLVGAFYGKDAREEVNLVAVWQSDQKEPWFIATILDHPRLAVGLYRKRMKIEHGFRDWKHHLKLKGTLKVTSAKRAQALLRTLALLYWFLCLVGIRVNKPKYQAMVSYWGKPSMFFLALQLFKRGVEEVIQSAYRMVEWIKAKLKFHLPQPPAPKVHHRRFQNAPS
jgi:hypothetical protein